MALAEVVWIQLPEIEIKKQESGYVGKFIAMASPCEVLVDTQDEVETRAIVECVAAEAIRIEQSFSRYRDDNLIYRINNSQGHRVEVDDELARLFDFSTQCYLLSDGLFDITSGVLRRIWRFDGSDSLPSRKQAKALLPLVGWNKVTWKSPYITLQHGMEIDLGGIGKEYAVDSAAKLVRERWSTPVLINFGGDLYATDKPVSRQYWQIGVESLGGGEANAIIQLQRGGLATSGDARRFLERDGVRYSHVLNPRTGWPVSNTLRAVTVAAANCIDAGFLSTMALLKGKNGKAFLDAQKVKYWIQ
jgi:thiamine biosynthesis lipoprotein